MKVTDVTPLRTALPTAGGTGRERARVPLDLLQPSHSPRVNGESDEHARVLAQLDTGLPPILVQRSTMRVIDGMHRLRAAQLRGDDGIEVEFFDGEEADAFVLAVRLNIAHGLPLTQADRNAAADRILAAFPYWSDRRVAASTGLAAGTVAALRRRSTDQDGQLNVRVGRDGRARPLHAAEGRRRAAELIAAHPEASLREIAESAGIAPATAKDVRDRMRAGQDPVAPRGRLGAAGTEPRGCTVPARQADPVRPAQPRRLVLSSLGKDPSLRTEAGRRLLRMLSDHHIGDDDDWHRMAQGVPGHQVELLAQAARRCADHWLRLAAELETRRP
ncbi:streptomycin biosynthesis protein [Kitasatospora sp. NPDC087861]|uniref:ParB/RepB/Spo0J family partition protein n=1 Tax=Kitasatospora sp. NPDC087861 TaxID=3364070 RepID=UPI00382718F0